MIRLETAFDLALLDNIQDLARTHPALARRYAKRELRPFVSNLVTKRLRREPGAVVYPIQWTSDKQRMAFFATDGFGHGIPYTRSGRMEHDWHVIGDYRAGFSGISISNENPAARYVYGDEEGQHQQLFHENTGWPTFAQEAQIISLEANLFFEDGWASLVDQALSGRRYE